MGVMLSGLLVVDVTGEGVTPTPPIEYSSNEEGNVCNGWDSDVRRVGTEGGAVEKVVVRPGCLGVVLVDNFEYCPGCSWSAP